MIIISRLIYLMKTHRAVINYVYFFNVTISF